MLENLKAQSRRLLGTEEPEEKTALQEIEERICACFPSMTYKQRLIGFACCLLCGSIITAGSLFRILQLIRGNPVPFVVFYTVGNLISICASFFLYGPWAQTKKMFAPTRALATCIYLGTLVLCLFVAFASFVPARAVLLLVLVVVQFLAFVWYSVSFIPFARQWFKALIRGNCMDCGD